MAKKYTQKKIDLKIKELTDYFSEPENQKDLTLKNGYKICPIAFKVKDNSGKVYGQSHINYGLPSLEINTKNAKRSIDVGASSIEQDNDTLLHLLFSKTRKTSNK